MKNRKICFSYKPFRAAIDKSMKYPFWQAERHTWLLKYQQVRFSYKQFKADVDGSLICPFWEKAGRICLSPFQRIYTLFPERIRYFYPLLAMRGVIFSILNRSAWRFRFTFSLALIFIVVSHVGCLMMDWSYQSLITGLCLKTVTVLFLTELLILHYHIVRIYGEVTDKYIPPLSREKDHGLLPLTDGSLIPNNLWFYQHLNVGGFDWSDDLSDVQAFIHGEQYTICTNNLWKYAVWILGLYFLS